MGERFYRLLLRLYPASFRDEFEAELLELFRRRRQKLGDHRSMASRADFWWTMIGDTVRTAWAEQRSPSVNRQDGGGGMEGWIQDTRYALRRLVRSPGFTIASLAILAFGIGVNTAAFSLVNALLLQDPPFQEPDRLVELLQDSDGGDPSSTSYPAYLDIAEHTEIFSSVAARTGTFPTLDRDGAISTVLADFATSDLLRTLGLSVTRGRWFTAGEDHLGAEPVAVISHTLWSRDFGSDPGILGRQLRLNGRSVTVVGVGPREWDGGYGTTAGDLWLSTSAMDVVGGPAASLTRRTDHPMRVVARLAPGVTREAAVAAMDRLAERLAVEYPEINRNRRIHVLPMTTIGAENRADVVPAAGLVMFVVVLVLLVASVNLANLLLVRGAARSREIGVRFALGGSRGRLIRVLFGEVLILAVVGGGLGLVLAWWLLGFLGRLQIAGGPPISMDIRMDTTVLLFTVGVSLLASVIAGLLPAVRSTAAGAMTLLNDRGGKGRGRFGLTGALVAVQVAVSLVLLVTAGLFTEEVLDATSADPGFEYERVAQLRIGLGPLELDAAGLRTTYAALEERIERLPQVEGVALANRIPLGGGGTTTLLVGDMVDGRRRPVEVPWNLVAPDYFETLGVPLLHGRLFDSGDRPEDPRRALVSEAMARAFWGRTDVVGEEYRAESAPDEPVEIVGVVGDLPVSAVNESPRPTVYWSTTQMIGSTMFLMARTSGEAIEILNPMRSTVLETDARIPILGASTMESFLSDSLSRQRLVSLLLSLVGVFALALATLGIYAIVSFGVARRLGEVGIRMALGAARSSVVGLFMREAVGVIGVGALLGLALVWPVSRLVGSTFIGGAGLSIPVLAVCVGALVTAGLVATWLPSRRAARLDPVNTLREE